MSKVILDKNKKYILVWPKDKETFFNYLEHVKDIIKLFHYYNMPSQELYSIEGNWWKYIQSKYYICFKYIESKIDIVAPELQYYVIVHNIIIMNKMIPLGTQYTHQWWINFIENTFWYHFTYWYIHTDLHLWNIIFSHTNKLYFIDYESIHYEPVVCQIVYLMFLNFNWNLSQFILQLQISINFYKKYYPEIIQEIQYPEFLYDLSIELMKFYCQEYEGIYQDRFDFLIHHKYTINKFLCEII